MQPAVHALSFGAKEAIGGGLSYDYAVIERELVDSSLHIPIYDPEYAPKIKRMFEIAFEELPRIPLYQSALNVATNGAEGYEFWFHRQLDVRPLKTT